jgi:hypothetical protein
METTSGSAAGRVFRWLRPHVATGGAARGRSGCWSHCTESSQSGWAAVNNIASS